MGREVVSRTIPSPKDSESLWWWGSLPQGCKVSVLMVVAAFFYHFSQGLPDAISVEALVLDRSKGTRAQIRVFFEKWFASK